MTFPLQSGCLKTLRREHGFEPLTVEGRIPHSLNGTLYRLGVGRFETAGIPNAHWFDGEGGLAALRLENGKAFGGCRILRADLDESGQRGRFGSAPKSLWKRISATWDYSAYVNSANTALFRNRDKLYALYEGSIATEVDPKTLEATRQETFGIIKRAFSAHPKYLPGLQSTFNFGFRVLPRPSLDVYAFPAAESPRHLGSVPYSGATFLHDFVKTEHFVAFVVSPLFGNPREMIFDAKPLSQAMHWKPQAGTEILISRMDSLAKPIRIELDAFLFTHTANAYESGNTLIFDGICYEDASNMDWIHSVVGSNTAIRKSKPGHVYRFEIDVNTRTVRREKVSDAICEVPQINPALWGAPHRYAYAAGYKNSNHAGELLYDCTTKIDTKSGNSQSVDYGAGQVVSEPIFVPQGVAQGRSAEDDGYLLALNYDENSDRSYFAVLRAQDKPEIVAKIWFDQPVPFTFHGLWWDRHATLQANGI